MWKVTLVKSLPKRTCSRIIINYASAAWSGASEFG